RMEGLALDLEFLNATIAAAGLAILFAVAIGILVFNYIADEERKGRRIDWLEEPLAMPGDRVHPQTTEKAKLPKAA
ncbi:MAG: hypothetical protein ACRDFW_05895, partial [bacterium]